MKKNNFFYYLAAMLCAAYITPANAITITQVDKIVPELPNANDYACMAYSNHENIIFAQCFSGKPDNSEERMQTYNNNVRNANDKLKHEKEAYQNANQELAANAEASRQKAGANDKLKQMSGMNVDVDSLSKMTEEQKQAFGHKIAARKMSEAGSLTGMMGGMSQEEIMKLSKMSDKEREAYMMQKMSGSEGMGLSMDEMQKFSTMNDKEIAEYVKSHPEVAAKIQNSRMGKMAAANAGKINARTQAAQNGVQNIRQKMGQQTAAQKQYMDAIDNKNMKAAQKQINALFNEKYKAMIKKGRENYSSCYIKYSPNGYIFADGNMSSSEERAMKDADKNCKSYKTWEIHYQKFTKEAGEIWEKAVKQDLSAIKTAAASGTLKQSKIATNFSNFTSPEMNNYVNNIPGIDGTEEYIEMLEKAKSSFTMPKEAAYCDQAWLAHAKSIEDKSEKNSFYQYKTDELGGCSAAQLSAAGITQAKTSRNSKANINKSNRGYKDHTNDDKKDHSNDDKGYRENHEGKGNWDNRGGHHGHKGHHGNRGYGNSNDNKDFGGKRDK